jgi:hypothetical protein
MHRPPLKCHLATPARSDNSIKSLEGYSYNAMVVLEDSWMVIIDTYMQQRFPKSSLLGACNSEVAKSHFARPACNFLLFVEKTSFSF